MKLTGKYRIVVEGDTSQIGGGSNPDAIGHLFQRLLSGEEAVMANLANLGITVREIGEDQDEYIAIRREAME